MTFRQIRYFVAAAEELHFGRAAERLDMAQPPLSRQIKQLEEELGAVLFSRSRNSITLTQAGERLYARATAIMETVADTEREIRRIGQGMEGRLRLGFVGLSVYGIVPTIIKSFRAHCPDIFLSLTPMNNAGLHRALIQREIDVAIARPALRDREFATTPLIEEPLIVAAPDTLMPERHAIEAAALNGRPFILYPEYPRPGFADVVLNACAAQGIDASRRMFTMDLQTALSLVAIGEGIAVVPGSVGSAQRNGIRFHPVKPSLGTTALSLNQRLDEQGVHVQNFQRIAKADARRSF